MHYIVDKVNKGNCVAKNDKHNVQLTMAQQASVYTIYRQTYIQGRTGCGSCKLIWLGSKW